MLYFNSYSFCILAQFIYHSIFFEFISRKYYNFTKNLYFCIKIYLFLTFFHGFFFENSLEYGCLKKARKEKRMEYQELIAQAVKAKEFAYVPYSNFRVGAALLATSGRIYTGCNIENAGFSATNCAERTAVFKAVSEGEREFEAIVINGDNHDYLPPCGVCRQVLAEFCDPDTFQVIFAKNQQDYRIMTLGELLPEAFRPENLKSKKQTETS